MIGHNLLDPPASLLWSTNHLQQNLINVLKENKISWVAASPVKIIHFLVSLVYIPCWFCMLHMYRIIYKMYHSPWICGNGFNTVLLLRSISMGFIDKMQLPVNKQLLKKTRSNFFFNLKFENLLNFVESNIKYTVDQRFIFLFSTN